MLASVTVALASPVPGMDKGIGQTSAYPKRGEFPQQNSSNPYLNFTEQDFTWRELEPSEGNYQWQILDDYIGRWAGTGKKIIPHIVIVHNTTANPTYPNAVPQYVYDAGADFFTVEAQGTTYVRPVPWDPVFLGKFATFIQAFAARYDGHPEIWNVDITLGRFSTTHLSTAQSSEFQDYLAKGYTEQRWSDAIREAVAIYSNAFASTPLRFVVTFFIGSDDGSAAGILAKEAAAQGIIVHNHNLRGNNGFLNEPWLGLFEEIHTLYPNAKTSFGTDTVARGVDGTITQVAQYAFGGVIPGVGTFPKSHISYLTLYPPDMDKADPASTKYDAAYQAALDYVLARLEPVASPSLGAAWSGNNFVLSWPAVDGFSYQVQWSAGLLGWTNAGAAIPAAANSLFWVDDGTQTGAPPSQVSRRFYRVQVLP